ncbi:hypothetical protein AALP_AA5G017300 [Arabis alpina]|uniref:Uncharacterized protein n=1 Tax=Arabis alpina TaxID=50452 RepID=A0A087GUB7_ARAAL|nr:hypothetical protein AALP_AA5G017300 [Arabis alpina]
MNLSYSRDLKEIPNLSTATNLQELNLEKCSSVMELPSSIGNAANLQVLNLSYCSSLVELPSSIGNATNLQNLDLRFCTSLVELPSSIGNATSLQDLDLSHCSNLVELPSLIGNAIHLQNLDLTGCSSLVELPSSIWNATNLQELNLRYCSSLVNLPFSFGNATNLQDLNLQEYSSLVELPSSMRYATNLQRLDFQCCSLEDLPSSIENLHRLTIFDLEGCSKLEVLPTNITLESLRELSLSNCSSLKSFPEISTNIEYLTLNGTAIEEVPSSIRLWSRLRGLLLNEMQNLVSLPQLPDSLAFLFAENCESLERLDCSFSNPDIYLNFRNCFKLNQDARDVIIQTSTTNNFSVLPGGEVPACFTYRASGSSVTVELNDTSTKFKACILLANTGKDEYHDWVDCRVSCFITSKQNARTPCKQNTCREMAPIMENHLYIFDVEAEDVTSTELVFEFKLIPSFYSKTDTDTYEIKECGILQHLDLQVDEER